MATTAQRTVPSLESGMRVLDLGCGSALSSVFLAKEFGVEVWATDLWVKPDENLGRVVEVGLQDRVHPVYAEAHALPFADGFTPRAVLALGLLRLAQPGLVAPALGEDRPGHR